MEIQNQREEQLEDLRRQREAFVQVNSITFDRSTCSNFRCCCFSGQE